MSCRERVVHVMLSSRIHHLSFQLMEAIPDIATTTTVVVWMKTR